MATNTATNRSEIDEIAADCLAVRIRLLNRVVSGIFDEALRPLGIKVSQLNVLVVIAKKGQTTPADVGRRLQLEKSTLSRNVERMRKRGWIAVRVGKDDRSHVLTTTSRGRKLLERAYPLWQQAQESTRELLGESRASGLRSTANAVWSQFKP